MPESKLNVGCGVHYAEGWVNTDVVNIPGVIEPDELVLATDPFPFFGNSFDKAYVGHIIEHVPWSDIPQFFAQLDHVLIPGSEVMIVGPDTRRVIDGYKNGTADIHQVEIAIEGVGHYGHNAGEFETDWRWDGDRHHWNCYEQRVVDLLVRIGWGQVTAYDLDVNDELPVELEEWGWPVVSRSRFQFAVSARTPDKP